MTSQTGVELQFYRYWSEQNNYLAITTSTGEPAVDEYMVFTLRLNFFIEEVNYLVSHTDCLNYLVSHTECFNYLVSHTDEFNCLVSHTECFNYLVSHTE